MTNLTQQGAALRPPRAKVGESDYPIKPGTIFELLGSHVTFNRLIKARCDHRSFLWIASIGKIDPKRDPKERMVTIIWYHEPKLVGMEKRAITTRTQIQLETIVRYLGRRGFVVRGHKRYNHTTYALKCFYRLIGVL